MCVCERGWERKRRYSVGIMNDHSPLYGEVLFINLYIVQFCCTFIYLFSFILFQLVVCRVMCVASVLSIPTRHKKQAYFSGCVTCVC